MATMTEEKQPIRVAPTNYSKIPIDDSEENILEIIPLGAGQEVGRSCIVIKYKGKCVMVYTIFILAHFSFYLTKKKYKYS